MAVSATRDLAPTPRSSYSSYASRDSLRPDSELLALRMRLHSVLELEDVLKRRLATEPECELPPSSVAPIPTISTMFRRRTNKEIAVNSSVEWKSAFMRDGVDRQSLDTENGIDWEGEDDPGPMLHARCEDMQRLWGHTTVRAILEWQGIRLQESPGLCVDSTSNLLHVTEFSFLSFLDELEVVTSLRYVPTDGEHSPHSIRASTPFVLPVDHILRARLKTLVIACFLPFFRDSSLDRESPSTVCT